jgi:N-acetylneuraminate synthase
MNNCIYVAELGINGNGSLNLYLQLIDLAKKHGFDYVKFQKRDIDSCYTQEYLDSPRESPWGKTQRDQKLGLELSIDSYKIIDEYCRKIGIGWYYSPWDVRSAELMSQFKTDYIKIAKACLTNNELKDFYRSTPDKLIVSINMEKGEYFDFGIAKHFPNIAFVLSCVSLYPSPDNFIGLVGISEIKKTYDTTLKYANPKPGYSNHSSNWIHPVIASYLGAEMIECHITLDKNMYGSDQKASLDDSDLTNMMKYRYNPPSQDEVNKYMLQEAEVLKKLRQTW